MNQNEFQGFREQLLGLGQRLKGGVATLSDEALRKVGGDSSGNLSNTPVHIADLGSDAFEQEVALSLLENQEHQLEEVAAALRRCDAGTFGRCESCEGEIGRERLDALPYARHCIDCARQEQAVLS